MTETTESEARRLRAAIWSNGPLPFTRDPVQVETSEGKRVIISCPACGGARGLAVARWRQVSKELAKALVARRDSPYGVPGNKEGERLTSKCCQQDIRVVDEKFICSYCLEVCEATP